MVAGDPNGNCSYKPPGGPLERRDDQIRGDKSRRSNAKRQRRLPNIGGCGSRGLFRGDPGPPFTSRVKVRERYKDPNFVASGERIRPIDQTGNKRLLYRSAIAEMRALTMRVLRKKINYFRVLGSAKLIIGHNWAAPRKIP